MATFTIIAYTGGARTYAGTIHGDIHDAVAAAQTQAVMRGEYVTVEIAGQQEWAVVGAEGRVA